MSAELYDAVPAIAASAGFIGGVIVDRLAGQRGNAAREAALSTQGVSEEEFQSGRLSGAGEAPAVHKPGILENIRNHPAVPVSAALGVGLTTLAFQSEQAPKISIPTPVTLIGDHSFRTGTPNAGGDGSYQKVNTIFEQFQNTGKIRVKMRVDHNGQPESIHLADMLRDVPDGHSDLPEALSTAMENANDDAAPANRNLQTRPDIVIVTDNQSIGDAKQVIKRARANGQARVYVANVGEGNDQIAQELQTITQATGGSYVAAASNPAAAAANIKHSLKVSNEIVEDKANDKKIAEKIFGIATIALALGLIKSRAEVRFKGRLKAPARSRKLIEEGETV